MKMTPTPRARCALAAPEGARFILGRPCDEKRWVNRNRQHAARRRSAALAAACAAAASRPGNAGTDPGRRAQQDLPAIRQRPVRALAHRLRLSDPAHLLRPALAAMEWPPGRAVRPGRAQVLPVRPGAVAAGRGLPGGAAGDLGAGVVPVHRRGRPVVLRLRLSADRLHRDLHVDRAQGRRRPRGPHPPGRVALVLAQGAVEDHQAFPVDRAGLVDRLDLHRLFRAHPRTGT